MAKDNPRKVAEVVRWLGPVLDALRELGGSGTPKQVEEIIARSSQVTDSDRAELQSGQTRFYNQINWARQYLVYEGLIYPKDPSTGKQGSWVLTEVGKRTILSIEDAQRIAKKGTKLVREQRRLRDLEKAGLSAVPVEPVQVTPSLPAYDLAKCSQETGFPVDALARWVKAIERKKQAILYGPPGTGKTFVAERLARYLSEPKAGFFEIVQFHPAYSYEEFVQGIRPTTRTDGKLEYKVVPGRFIEFCRRAEKCEGRCVLIVDEINRANLSRVFGELMFLLEYRDREVPLAAGGRFHIPKNVRLLGTMNTADRSIALVDHALRRRFAFLALNPDYEILQQFFQNTEFNAKPLVDLLKELNRNIRDRHLEVGITFFLRLDIRDQLEDIWQMEVEPYLEEVFFDREDVLGKWRWEQVRGRLGS